MTRIYAQPLVRLTLILSAIFVLLITLMFLESRMGGDADREPNPAATAGRAAPVEEFIDFATAGPEEGPPVGVEHDYTAEGIRKLVSALRVLVSESGGAATDELAHFDEQADRLGRDRRSHEHADIVRFVQCFRCGAGMRAGPANTDTAARRAGVNQAARVDAVLYQRFGSIGRGSGFVGGVPGGFGGGGDGGSGFGLGVGG